MKHLQSFQLFEAHASVLTPDQKEFLNVHTEGTWSVNPKTGLVDVSGNFVCGYSGLKTLLGISLGQVSGNFSCSYNQLTTLEGAPQTVGGNFNCDSNQLTSLEGAPQKVDGGFYCYNNLLTTLEGAPQTVGGVFFCGFFFLYKGEWNPSGWAKILRTGNAAAQKLMKTLPWTQPDWWNSELQRDPGKTLHLLAPWWNHMPKNLKSRIVIPPGYEDEFGLFSGFDELGLF